MQHSRGTNNMPRGGDFLRNAPARRAARAQLLAQTNRVLAAIAWAMAGLFSAYLLTQAPQRHRQLEQAQGAEIDGENTAFCEKLGLLRRTPAFRSCVLDLMEIRANQER